MCLIIVVRSDVKKLLIIAGICFSVYCLGYWTMRASGRIVRNEIYAGGFKLSPLPCRMSGPHYRASAAYTAYWPFARMEQAFWNTIKYRDD